MARNEDDWLRSQLALVQRLLNNHALSQPSYDKALSYVEYLRERLRVVEKGTPATITVDRGHHQTSNGTWFTVKLGNS